MFRKAAAEAISAYEEVQEQIADLSSVPDYADEDLTDDGQDTVNINLLEGVKTLERARLSLKQVIQLQNKLYLEAIPSFSTQAAVERFEDVKMQLEIDASDIDASDITDALFHKIWDEVQNRFRPVHQRMLDQARMDVTSDSIAEEGLPHLLPLHLQGDPNSKTCFSPPILET